MQVKIGELAKMAGCQVVTIRYYEKEGLLPVPERTGANYRLYDREQVERLRFILHCRHHGMALAEIRELLAFKDNPTKNCAWINGLIAAHIAKVTEQIDALSHLKAHLQDLLHKCEGDRVEDCGILQSLNSAESCPCHDFGGQPCPLGAQKRE